MKLTGEVFACGGTQLDPAKITRLPVFFGGGACGDGLGTIMAGDMGISGHSHVIRALKSAVF